MRAWARRNRQLYSGMVEGFCERYSLNFTYLTDYQIRIEGVLDVYPVRHRYHLLRFNERGEFKDTEDLRKLMVKATGGKVDAKSI